MAREHADLRRGLPAGNSLDQVGRNPSLVQRTAESIAICIIAYDTDCQNSCPQCSDIRGGVCGGTGKRAGFVVSKDENGGFARYAGDRTR